ncbi:hypothetical protein [Phenylobacterium sp.]|uniref:hypothetical protein n=1 Tax=Phenylobacterium sp. TaxID=1871053 RepID=UPI003962F561
MAAARAGRPGPAPRNGRRTFEALGYSVEELVAHIERQFLPGMGWKNVNEWHIDHIRPLSSFDIRELGDAEFRAAWALTNLRPIWSALNLAKGAKLQFLL